MTDVIEKLSNLQTYPQELGIDLETEEGRFKWFLASILFSKRISADIAKSTYREFEKEGLVTPDRITEAGWDKLVEVLDAGGYVRYDYSTATTLLGIAGDLKEKYGSLETLYEQSKDTKDLEKRLQEFKGVGQTTVNIFLRDLKAMWGKARPKISPPAIQVASRLDLTNEQLELPDVESALVRINLEFCKRKRCSSCPVKEDCKEASAS
ncbi:MAG: hypothetical protein ACLFPU_06070 [Dehalococcoidia bacterium]